MDARIIEQPNITRNGPQHPRGTHIIFTGNDVWTGDAAIILFLS